MTETFDAATLDHLRAAHEIGIRTSNNPDRTIVIWIVVADDAVFVRSFRGKRGRWYNTAAAEGHAVLLIGDRPLPVRAIVVTHPDTIEAVSQAFLTKYAPSPYAGQMVLADTLATTLRLVPTA
jgi:hypothetical protein